MDMNLALPSLTVALYQYIYVGTYFMAIQQQIMKILKIKNVILLYYYIVKLQIKTLRLCLINEYKK
jgi:hypothetical protein